MKRLGSKIFLIVCFTIILTPAFLQAQPRVDDMPWRVYMQVEPCVDNREQWMMVAREQPAFGPNHWIIPQSATPQATMAGALAEADMLSLSDPSAETMQFARFENYCCHDWSIYKNSATNQFIVLKGIVGIVPDGFSVEQGSLCCETARVIADLPGGCRNYTLADGVTTFTKVSPGFTQISGPVVTPPSPPTDPSNPGTITVVEIPEDGGGGNVFHIPTHTGTTTTITTTTPTTTIPTAPTTPTNQNNPNPPTAGGRWVLESVTVSPATPTTGWTYTAQSSSAHFQIYNGDQANFTWTPPPQQIDMNGFTISMSANGTPADPKGRVACIIGASGSGIESDTPSDDRAAYAKADAGPSSATKSVTFKPQSNYSEIEVRIGMQWAVEFTYKYRRAN